MADMKLPMSLAGQDMKGCRPCDPGEYDKRGPMVTLTWDEPYNLPDEGEMTVTFKVRKREEEIEGDKKTFELRLELTEITAVKSDESKAPAKGESETGTILDDMRKSLKG